MLVSVPGGSASTSSAATLTVQANTQSPTLMSASRVANSATDILLAYSIANESCQRDQHRQLFAQQRRATISSAIAGSSAPNQVILTTSGLTSSNAYYLSAQNVKDTFNNTMVPTSTLVVPANLSIWLKADAGVITDIPSSINEWDDQSANTNNALQFSQSDRMPTYASGAINGLPAARFDGLSNYLEAASSPSLAFNGDMTIYVIANFADFTGPREILGKTLANQPAPFDYYAQNATTLRFYRGNGTVNNSAVGAKNISAGSPHLLSVTMQGTNVSQYLDSALNATRRTFHNHCRRRHASQIGSRDDLFQFMKGDISEIIIFNSSISANDRAAVNL